MLPANRKPGTVALRPGPGRRTSCFQPAFRGMVIVSLFLHHSLTWTSVLWTEANIHYLDGILLDLADSMCRCAKYGDSRGRAISQWCIRKCIPQYRWWDCRGPVSPSATSDSDDDLHWCSFRWTSSRAYCRRFHKFIRLLVNPQRLSTHIC